VPRGPLKQVGGGDPGFCSRAVIAAWPAIASWQTSLVEPLRPVLSGAAVHRRGASLMGRVGPGQDVPSPISFCSLPFQLLQTWRAVGQVLACTAACRTGRRFSCRPPQLRLLPVPAQSRLLQGAAQATELLQALQGPGRGRYRAEKAWRRSRRTANQQGRWDELADARAPKLSVAAKQSSTVVLRWVAGLAPDSRSGSQLVEHQVVGACSPSRPMAPPEGHARKGKMAAGS